MAVGPNVFIYRNLRPYFKFTLPLEVVNELEKTVWYMLVLLYAAVLRPISIGISWSVKCMSVGSNCMLEPWTQAKHD